jgi:hypothetical protein
MAAAAAEAKAQYSATVLDATGNVGGRIVQLLIKNPLCKKVVVVSRRKTDAFADPKVSEAGDGALLRQGRERRALSSSRDPKLDFPFATDTLGGSEMAHRRLLIDSRQKVNRIG